MAKHGEQITTCDQCGKVFDRYSDDEIALTPQIKGKPLRVRAIYPHDICAECLRELIGVSVVVKREFPQAVFIGVAVGVLTALLVRAVIELAIR